MGTNCAPLLADLFLYSYESEFLQNLVKDKKIHGARAFNFTYRYTDDVLSINNPRFAEFLPLIYPPELEIKETTDTASSASFLKDDVSRNQNNCYWPLHNESIARCKHHMQEKLVYCCTYL
jgi:hypothetical protein